MADVQYTTLYLPDGTGVSVVVGSQLYLTYVASGATTSPPTFTPSTSTSPAAPDVRIPVATVWFHTPFGPQPITAPDIIDEYRRRDYAELSAAQAAAFYASGAEIPDVSYVTGVELPAAMAAVAAGNNAFATAQRAAFVPFKQLALNPDMLIAGTITRDANGAATAAPVVWPDGTAGLYTATTVSSAFPGAVDAYTITYGSPATKTYTQPAVTRNATGAVTQRPALQVA